MQRKRPSFEEILEISNSPQEFFRNALITIENERTLDGTIDNLRKMIPGERRNSRDYYINFLGELDKYHYTCRIQGIESKRLDRKNIESQYDSNFLLTCDYLENALYEFQIVNSEEE